MYFGWRWIWAGMLKKRWYCGIRVEVAIIVSGCYGFEYQDAAYFWSCMDGGHQSSVLKVSLRLSNERDSYSLLCNNLHSLPKAVSQLPRQVHSRD